MQEQVVQAASQEVRFTGLSRAQVTQWQVIACVRRIMLPALDAMLDQFSFKIRGFHSGNARIPKGPLPHPPINRFYTTTLLYLPNFSAILDLMNLMHTATATQAARGRRASLVPPVLNVSKLVIIIRVALPGAV